jgi:hypothetical protein
VGFGRAALWGAAVAVLVAVALAAGVVVLLDSDAASMARPGDSAMIVLATRAGQEQGRIASLIIVADASAGRVRLTLVDPQTTVTVPGTSAARLRDAYAFGGAAAVSSAWAALHRGRPVPAVGVSQEALLSWMHAQGPVHVDVPSDQNVFDGTRLYTFTKGSRDLGGDEIVALLGAADFAKGEEGGRIREAVARGILASLARVRPDETALSHPGVTSTLRSADLLVWSRTVASGLGAAEIVPAGR